jgi:hypothetical protein
LDGFQNDLSFGTTSATQNLYFLDLQTIYELQSSSGSLKGMNKCIVDLSKKEHPFTALSSLLQKNIKKINGNS